MTPWEWSLALLTIAPVISCVAAVLLHKQQAGRASAFLLLLAGLAGVFACVLGAIAEAPFTLQTAIFFGMTAAFDKFSAILFLPFACVLAAVGIHRLQSTSSEERGTTRSVLMLAVAAMATTWTVMATNIVALGAALTLLVSATLVLMIQTGAPLRSISRWFMVRFGGVLCILAGWFFLSAGALFNDFSTISYIAAQVEPVRLAVSFGLVLVGVACFGYSAIPVHQKDGTLDVIHSPEVRALLRTAYLVIPTYILLRLMLFVLPPLTVWFAAGIAFIGVTLLLSSVRQLQKGTLQSTTSACGAGMILSMIASAVTFQATGLFDAMNAALFGTLVTLIGGTLASAAGEWNLNAKKTGGLLTLAQRMSALGLPPSALFVGQWMFVTTILVSLRVVDRRIALGLLLLLGVFVWTWMTRARMAATEARRALSLSSSEPVAPAPLVLLVLSVVGAFFVPFGLDAIGAGPLTLGATQWNGAVVSGDGALRISFIALAILIASLVLWVFRNRAVQDGGTEIELAAEGEGEDASRMEAFRRDVARLGRQYVVTPATAKYQVFHQWYDARSARLLSPALFVMTVTVILTLVLFV